MPGRTSLNLLGLFIWVVTAWRLLDAKPSSTDSTGGNTLAKRVMLVLFVASMVTLTPLPLHLAILLDHGQLEEFVRTRREVKSPWLRISEIGAGSHDVHYHAGIFPIMTYEIEPNGSAFLLTAVDEFGPAEFHGNGFAYKPAGLAVLGLADFKIEHIFGDWYTFNFMIN